MVDDNINGDKEKFLTIAVISTILTIIIAVIIFIFFVIIPYGNEFKNDIDNERKKQIKYVEPGEKALGFYYGTPYVNDPIFGKREVFSIINITPNGPMDKAGAEVGDIILKEGSIGDFFQEIYEHRESIFSFEVEREGKKLKIKVDVPYYEVD